MKNSESLSANSLSARDRRVLWHPYTQMQTAPPPVGITRGEGAYVFDEEGNRWFDAISSWWVNLHGHSHPHIVERLTRQIETLDHVIFAGFTHAPAVELGERLLPVLPGRPARLFYSDNGSTAVAVALKMAFQFFHQQGKPRSKVIALRRAYHGDTFEAMAVSERGTFTAPFKEHLFDVHFVDVPHDSQVDRSVEEFERVASGGDVAAFIFEPCVQGVAGFLDYPAHGLDRLCDVARRHGVLTIADEVFTGFGRTGPLFASSELAHSPDLICLSKGITGGTLPLGATSATEEIYDSFLSDDRTRAFFHGHSYTANPLACAAGCASLDLTLADACTDARRSIEASHRAFADGLKDHPRIRAVRIRGTILAVELETEGRTSYFDDFSLRASAFAGERGVLLRPLGNVLYTVPPYCSGENELRRVYDVIDGLLSD